MKLVTIGEILVEFISHERNCALEKITEYSALIQAVLRQSFSIKPPEWAQ